MTLTGRALPMFYACVGLLETTTNDTYHSVPKYLALRPQKKEIGAKMVNMILQMVRFDNPCYCTECVSLKSSVTDQQHQL